MAEHTEAQEIPTVGIYGANTGDLFGGSDSGHPVCEYRYCDKPIPRKRLRHHAKYCCDWHGILERQCRNEERRLNRQNELLQQTEEFLMENREVLSVFIALALFAKQSGVKVGAKAIVELIRWFRQFRRDQFPQICDTLKETGTIHSSGQWKLNNSHTRYIRKIAEKECPELVGFFEDREGKV